MRSQLIECVPNFSEGRDPEIIRQIAEAIKQVDGVQLLNVDPGYAANRTVMTFVGRPDWVVEAAFKAAQKASELIDMQKHSGEHPRFGALDVCPLIPIANISMEETVAYARRLAKRLGQELNISVYCYELAASNDERRSLANCRSGEYEGLPVKLKTPGWEPDYGPVVVNLKSGAAAVGARNFLIAYNVNLDTDSVTLASAIAADVRESGRALKQNGRPVRDEKGNVVRVPGSLKRVRAIGWYIKEYKAAQVSMNLIDIKVTTIHQAFEEVKAKAAARGVRVTGSELIGLIPLKPMLEAGRFYSSGATISLSEKELVDTAIRAMGLDALAPFDPHQRIIEYVMNGV